MPAAFQITNWPVASPSAKKEIEGMRDTHVVVPLPAYDDSGTLIAPGEYRATLKGATAVVRFDLAHWCFAAREGKAASDTFVANLRRIDVLRKPVPHSGGTLKHFLDMHDPLPSNVSLSKRAKTE